MLQIATAFFHIDAQPRIDFADAKVEDNAANNGEHKTYDNPQIEVFVVICKNDLGDNLNNVDGLEICIDDILLLIGTDQQLAIVEDVASYGLSQESIESEIDQEQPRAEIAEPEGEEKTNNQSDAANYEADAPIEISQHGHDLVDLLMVVFLKWFIEEVYNASADAELCHTEETHDIGEHAREADELSAETGEEDPTGEEGQDYSEDVEKHAYLDVHHASV